MSVSVLVVDDEALIRAGFRVLVDFDPGLPWWAKPPMVRRRSRWRVLSNPT